MTKRSRNLFATPKFYNNVLVVVLAMTAVMEETDILSERQVVWLSIFNVGLAATINVLADYDEDEKFYTPKFLPGRDRPSPPDNFG